MSVYLSSTLVWTRPRIPQGWVAHVDWSAISLQTSKSWEYEKFP